MSTYDWLLFVHVTAAFAMVAAIVLFWTIVIATRRGPHPFADVAAIPSVVMIQAGAVLTLILGIALAIQVDEYHPWDGWIIAAYVLWLVGVTTGGAAGRAYQRVAEGGPDAAAYRRRGNLLHVVETAAVVLILLDMIFKPGA